MPLLIKICLVFLTVSIMILIFYQYLSPSTNKSLKRRDVRSAPCEGADCDTDFNLFSKFYQTFYAPVAFNVFWNTDCLSSCNGEDTTTINPEQPKSGKTEFDFFLPKPFKSHLAPRSASFGIQSSTKNPNLRSKTFTAEFDTSEWGLDLYFLMDSTEYFGDTRAEIAKIAPLLVEGVIEGQLPADLNVGFGLFGDKKDVLHKTIASPAAKRKVKKTKNLKKSRNLRQRRSTSDKLGERLPNYISMSQSYGIIIPQYRKGHLRYIFYLNGPIFYFSNYGLWNKLRLTSNFVLFGTKLAAVSKTESDLSQDVLTGLHQATRCTTFVGWRNNTWRMLMLITNKAYHMEGENKENGENVTYFDGQCHLQSNGKFGDQLYNQVHYPSVKQVKEAFKESEVTSIFAIASGISSSGADYEEKSNVVESYINLSTEITPTPQVVHLDGKVTNLVEIIENAFKTVSAINKLRVEIVGSRSDTSDIVYNVKCTNEGSSIGDNACTPQSDGIVSFQIEVTILCISVNTTTNTILLANIMGSAETKRFDLSSVCSSIGLQ